MRGLNRSPLFSWVTDRYVGASPSGKAAGFDPAIRRFESFRPSHDDAVDEAQAEDMNGALRPPDGLFAGNANPQLAQDIAHHLTVPLGRASVGRFSDGEVPVEMLENVRGQDVFVMQSTCAADERQPDGAAGDGRRAASAPRRRAITAVMPYFGYARQDRRPRAARVPITAKVVANMIAAVGRRPRADGGSARRPDPGLLRHPGRQRVCLAGAAGRRLEADATENLIVVSPDVGGVVRARALAKRLDDAELAIIDKRRPRANESEVMNIIGEVERQDLRADRRHGRHRRHAVRRRRRR